MLLWRSEAEAEGTRCDLGQHNTGRTGVLRGDRPLKNVIRDVLRFSEDLRVLGIRRCLRRCLN